VRRRGLPKPQLQEREQDGNSDSNPALYTAVGALAAAANAVRHSALTYTNSQRLARQLAQFELRGARTLKRASRKVRSRVR
jgi:hypothetical protein